MRSVLAIVALVAAAAAGAAARQQPPAQPTFRSGVDLVQLDAIVTDAQGNVVTGLTADDFDLSEGGTRQTIATFSLVNIPIERAERPLYSPTVVEPDVARNDGPEGRLYVFAFDDVTPATGLRTRLFLRRFIEQHFGANDVAAVTLLGQGRRTDAQSFTASRQLLLRAIDKFSGWPEDMPPVAGSSGGAPVAEFIAANRMSALKDLMEFLATLHGRRKTVLLLSEGLGVNMYSVIDASGATESRAGDIAKEAMRAALRGRSEEHTSELQSQSNL